MVGGGYCGCLVIGDGRGRYWVIAMWSVVIMVIAMWSVVIMVGAGLSVVTHSLSLTLTLSYTHSHIHTL